MDVDDRDDIPYIEQYLVATSTKSMAYRCSPKATQSPNTIYVWKLSRYWRRFLIDFPLVGLAIVAKEPLVDGRRSELTRLALVAVVRFFLLRDYLQPKILWRFSESNCVLFVHGSGIDEGKIGGILVASL